ncbi:sulfite oxidase [uncultured Roseovarius sp.]|uniref:sulfite oxidase n=1 Tax=uncultured Roseovarius sp. TaxID=293344 RepID=UPI00262B4A8A|nr:sulfite oxidase [uncultured Roseovarius sp.]
MTNPFSNPAPKPATQDGVFDDSERSLANRNSGTLLETLALDVTPTGAHYLLTHFDTPLLDDSTHRLTFQGAFTHPFEMSMDDIRARPQVTLPVTLECAGNGRASLSPRRYSMPWNCEAVGTYEWTGTLLAPLIAQAKPAKDVVEISFTGVDYGYDSGIGHFFGRSLTLAQLEELEVLLVYAMNGQPLLPQHGAPLRIVVPGWYGMASVKWLSSIEALTEPFRGYQQVNTYRYKDNDQDEGRPITEIRVKSLMVPPGVPDWISRARFVEPGPVTIGGRAWSGAGRAITRVEFGVDGIWHEADLTGRSSRYAWTGWRADWQAEPGTHVLQCRATDETGAVQPLDPPWDLSGFGNNAVQTVRVFVGD